MRNGPRNYEIIYEREERNPRATDYRKSILVYLKNTAFCIHIIYNAVIGWYIYVDFILVLFDSIVHFTTTFFFLDILCFFFLIFIIGFRNAYICCKCILWRDVSLRHHWVGCCDDEAWSSSSVILISFLRSLIPLFARLLRLVVLGAQLRA